MAPTGTHVPHLEIAEADCGKIGAHLGGLIAQVLCVALAKPQVVRVAMEFLESERFKALTLTSPYN